MCLPCFGICHANAQDNEKLVALTKQVMEAGTKQDLYLAFEDMTDLYFKENKYNEFVELLNSLAKQKNELSPAVNYYIAMARYYELKYLQESQNWNEYFNQGDTYRRQITQGAQETISATTTADALNIYARLILWLFHKDQQDASGDSVLSELTNAVLEYSKTAKNLVPIKDVADRLSSHNLKADARALYKIYVEKLIISETKDAEIESGAAGFLKEGNPELAENLYDVYIERITRTLPKENLVAVLSNIAKLFIYRDKLPKEAFDADYAEKVFKKIEEVGGKEAFNEELIYLRAYNLEKVKAYEDARRIYIELVERYPASSRYSEGVFKIAMFNTYVLRDKTAGVTYFEKLSQKDNPDPQVISSLYQLGLLRQWEGDLAKAKECFALLISRAGDNFTDTVTLAKERMKEIEESKPLDYNLKTFLDLSLKEENALFDMGKLDLKAMPSQVKKGEEVNMATVSYLPESGCLQVELQYLWSGHTGEKTPSLYESEFKTSYAYSGTKEINLVVVSPSGILDRSIYLIDVD